MEMKYLVLKLDNQLNIIKLSNKIDELIDGDDSIGISVKWRDLADILIECEIHNSPETVWERQESAHYT